MFKSLIFPLILIASASAVVFNCQFFMETVYVPHYTCYRPILSNINESNYLTAVQGSHLSGKSNLDVTWLDIYQPQNLTFFPKDIEKFFPNLVVISFQYTDIVSFIGDELQAFPELFFLDFDYNYKLERLPANLFKFNHLINRTDLDKCNLKYIGDGLFDDLTNLKTLYARNSNCVSGSANYDETAMLKILSTIRNNCKDIYATTTTTEKSTCGDNMSEMICNLQEQNEKILRENSEIKEN